MTARSIAEAAGTLMPAATAPGAPRLPETSERRPVELGPSEDEIAETHEVEDDWAIVVPAGVWHNVVNTGSGELKLYSLYSPPEHPDGTVHRTKEDAERAEHG
ncbi:MAG: hypothetical protein ACRDNI_10940 [Gaiellaceae bacterium]